jgi:lactoylglutathione lyase
MAHHLCPSVCALANLREFRYNGIEVMNMRYTFNHFNFNVFDLERSLKFYDEALGLKPVREKNAADGSFKLVFLGDGVTDFRLELTWLRDRTEPYDLGEQEYHLAFQTDDMEAAHARHEAMGCICFENPSMGIYFLEDPDGYWIEIIPPRKAK